MTLLPLLTLDPGLNGCGLAFFDDGALKGARYVPNIAGVKLHRNERVASMVRQLRDARLLAHWPAFVVVTECPQIYSAGKGKGNPNDLIPLAQIGAAFAWDVIGAEWVEFLPREWKGTLDPDVLIERIKSRLTVEEKAHVESFKRGGLDHNIWDAVGIGLHHLGRLAPRRIYAR